METIKCPCCGGETSNFLNCDYCGSYLVRFKKKNIAFDESLFGTKAKTIYGLQEELQANLEEQMLTHGRNHICTTVSFNNNIIEIRNPRSIGDTIPCDFGDKFFIFKLFSDKKNDEKSENNFYTVTPTNPFDNNDVAIILTVRVFEFSKSFMFGQNDSIKKRNFEEKLKLEWFEHTGISSLFIKCDDAISSAIEGKIGICHSYYLNFNKDSAGASRVISQFLYGTNNVDSEDPKLCYERTSDNDLVYMSKQKKIHDKYEDLIKNTIYLLSSAFLGAIIAFTYGLLRSGGKFITESITILSVVVLAPLIISVLYFFIRRWWRNRCITNDLKGNDGHSFFHMCHEQNNSNGWYSKYKRYLWGVPITITITIMIIVFILILKPSSDITISKSTESKIVSAAKKVCINNKYLDYAKECYDNGDYETAYEIWKKYALLDSVRGMNGLGVCYDNGNGVEQDYVEAVKWYRKAAEKGFAKAQLNLGNMYYRGDGVEQNYAEAVKWCRKAAEQGDASGQYQLGYMYSEGEGVEQNYAEAVKWYRKAAEQGFVDAQFNMGVMCEFGKGTQEDQNEAVSWYRKAAEQGDAEAQCYLATMYYRGKGVTLDYIEASKWYKKAAEQGLPRAECILGEMYYNGEGVEQNYAEAVKWYRKAAEQGHADGQCNLGYMYHFGYGVEQSYAEAMTWYQKAAEQGLPRAEYQLGSLYFLGQGTEQNDAEAIKWFTKAYEHGDPSAKKIFDEIIIPNMQ